MIRSPPFIDLYLCVCVCVCACACARHHISKFTPAEQLNMSIEHPAWECSTACTGMQHCMHGNAALHARECSTACTGMQHCMHGNAALHARECSTACTGMQHCMHGNAALHARECSTACTRECSTAWEYSTRAVFKGGGHFTPLVLISPPHLPQCVAPHIEPPPSLLSIPQICVVPPSKQNFCVQP